MDEASESEAKPATRSKGQRRVTWDDPGGWTDGGTGQGRFTVFPLGDDDHGPMVAVAEYAPNVHIGVHHHESDYCSVVVKGEIEVTRKLETVGSMRVVRSGTAYGPLISGPEGCTVIEFFEDRTKLSSPIYLDRSDQAAAESSPMTDLIQQVLRQTSA